MHPDSTSLCGCEPEIVPRFDNIYSPFKFHKEKRNNNGALVKEQKINSNDCRINTNYFCLLSDFQELANSLTRICITAYKIKDINKRHPRNLCKSKRNLFKVRVSPYWKHKLLEFIIFLLILSHKLWRY